MSKTKNRFTFKRHPRETGLRSVGHPYQSVDVKLNGKVVGTIHAPYWNRDGWQLMVMVNVRQHENCPWSWSNVRTFNTEQDARDFVLENADRLIAMDLRWDDDDAGGWE